MRFLKPLTISAFALALLSLPAMAQTTAVEGLIKDETGKLLPAAVVTFDRTDIKGKYIVKSDKKGHYGHYGLPLGTYTISVTVDGKERDRANNFRTGMGDPKTLNFDLKQSAEQAQALAKAAESGTMTKEQERGMSKEQKESFDKAAKARESQLAKNKQLNEAYTIGKDAVEAKQWDVAIESLEKANTMDATQVAVWSTLAEAYVGKALATPAEAAAIYEKGFGAFAKAIEMAPDASLYNNYALALAKNKKIDEAKANLAKAAELDPPGAGKYYYNLGALLVNSGQNDAATDTFKKAIDLDPNYADAQYQYGVALAGKASTDASGKVIPQPGTVEALEKYLQLKPEGQYAQASKDMIAALGATVSTTFSNPSAPAPKGKKK